MSLKKILSSCIMTIKTLDSWTPLAINLVCSKLTKRPSMVAAMARASSVDDIMVSCRPYIVARVGAPVVAIFSVTEVSLLSVLCYLLFVCLLWNSVLQWTHLGITVAFQAFTYLSHSFFQALLQNSLPLSPKFYQSPTTSYESWRGPYAVSVQLLLYRCL